MEYITGSFLVTATGLRTITGLPFEPKGLRIMAGKKSGQTENGQARFSLGFTDGENTFVDSHLGNANGFWTRDSDNYDEDYIVVLLSYPSGGPVNRFFSGEFIEFTEDGFSIDFDQVDASARVYFEAFG